MDGETADNAVVVPQLAKLLEETQRQLDACQKRCGELQDRYNQVNEAFNAPRQRVLDEVNRAFVDLLSDNAISEQTRRRIRQILANLST